MGRWGADEAREPSLPGRRGFTRIAVVPGGESRRSEATAVRGREKTGEAEPESRLDDKAYIFAPFAHTGWHA